jgi:phage baseplate assembly protein W
MAGITPKLPLSISPEGDYASIKTLTALVQQNFKNLILTAPGERVMDADFGVGLRRYLFEPFGPSLTQSIRANIVRQVGIYLPFVKIIDIFFDTTELVLGQEIDTETLRVIINYQITPLDVTNVLEISP